MLSSHLLVGAHWARDYILRKYEKSGVDFASNGQ